MAKKEPSKISKPLAKRTPATTGKPSVKKAAVKKAAKPIVEKKVTSTKKTTVSRTKPAKRPTKNTNDGLEIALILAQGMAERKAEDIKILEMRGVSGASSDFFVISHALSDKQVEAIADSAEEELFKTTRERPWHREGFENLEWVLLDYINVVAH